ncbi:hypothetical protein [Mycobacteroides abscessus]|uniref:hypothetical protein n=1 Tax=Mycobacteroides abscessus TaxID=36809 RepID=UPI00092CB7CD|nr:hypothetical protein [Mycobacteroides abscessus]SIF34814.1 Uncharacterised protein [Mycobacteroides abscessus subsp. abscessus]
MTAPIAAVDTTVVGGEPGLNAAAIGLLMGYPAETVEAWFRQGGLPLEAVQAGRRRAKEAQAEVGVELGMLEALTFYAIKERSSLKLDDEFIVRDGVAVAS